jgi:hypothetical protein
MGINNPTLNGIFKGILEDVIYSQSGFAIEGGGSSYRIYNDTAYNTLIVSKMSLAELAGVILQGLPKGLLYFLFSPFPVNVNNNLRLFAYPQMIFWYFTVTFAIFGFLKAILDRNAKILPAIYIFSFFTVLFSLVLGNEGIAARFRDMVSPFFYMLAGSALCNWFLPPTESQED